MRSFVVLLALLAIVRHGAGQAGMFSTMLVHC
jgi:hypothetical protein